MHITPYCVTLIDSRAFEDFCDRFPAEMTRPLSQRNWPWLLAAIIVALLFLSQTISIEMPIDDREIGTIDDVEALSERSDINVLFVLEDTLRADRLGAYGYERDTSPNFDAIADRGIRFANHLAQSSWTKCSMASLWTGLYPTRSGVTRLDHGLPEEATMPAEVFRDAGYRTAGIWRNGWVSPTFGFAQGFEVYDRPVSGPLPPEVRRDNPTVHAGGTDLDAVAAASEFFRTKSNRPWFLYLHLMDIHEYMYSEESALFGTAHSDVYDNSVRYASDVFGQLVAELAQTGQLDRTLIVIGSDHGEAFRERGLEGHARNVYRETTEVPWIISFPFKLDPGGVVDVRTANVDIWPTVFELLGLGAMDDTDGTSRLPEILGALDATRAKPHPDQETTFAHLDQTWGQNGMEPSPAIAIVEEPFRYVRSREARGEIREELFDRTNGNAELEDVLSREPEVAARMRESAEDYLSWEAAWEQDVPSLELDELELNHLRALGYAIP